MAREIKRQCCDCGKNLSKNEVALCQKMLGRNIESFFCLECLAVYLEYDVASLKEKIQEFKAQGCTLFS
jgi:hypothetical protein